MVFRPFDGSTAKLFWPRFLQKVCFCPEIFFCYGHKLCATVISKMPFTNPKILQTEITRKNLKNVTYKSLRLLRGRKASSWISEMLFFSMSLDQNFTFLHIFSQTFAKNYQLNIHEFKKRFLLTIFEDSEDQQRHSLTMPLSCSWNAKHCSWHSGAISNICNQTLVFYQNWHLHKFKYNLQLAF